MRRRKAILAAIIVAVLVAAGVIVLSGNNPFDTPRDRRSVSVGPKGGTFHLGGLTLQVSAGAVKTSTKLSVTDPTAVPASIRAPFDGVRTAAVRFDVSLGNGSVEPIKPIGLTVQLAGAFLPPGTTPQEALLYTPDNTATGFRLLPATVDGQRVLHASLDHLSSKFLTFVPLDKVFNFTFPFRKAKPQPCDQEVSLGTAGKVQLSGQNWSTKGTSPVRPCLEVNGQTVTVKIENQVHLVWTLYASDGVSVTSVPGDLDADAVQAISRLVFPYRGLRGYLSRDDTMTATVKLSNLPAAIRLEADSSPMLAEAGWVSLKFLAGLLIGENADGMVKFAKHLLELPDWQNCIRATVKSADKPDIPTITNALVSNCGQAMAKIANQGVVDLGLWNQAWNRVVTIWGGVKDAWSQVQSAYAGIKQQLRGGYVRVLVQQVVNPCLSSAQFLAAVASQIGSGEKRIDGGIVCQNGWAAAFVSEHVVPGDPNGWQGTFWVLVPNGNGGYKAVTGGSEGFVNWRKDPLCYKMPPLVAHKTGCDRNPA